MTAAVYDAFAWSNISATAFPSSGAPTSQNNGSPGSSTTTFALTGGVYVLSAVFSGTSVELRKLGPDGGTLLSLATPMKLTASGVAAPAYLPPGQYQLTLTSATACYADLSRVPTA